MAPARRRPSRRNRRSAATSLDRTVAAHAKKMDRTSQASRSMTGAGTPRPRSTFRPFLRAWSRSLRSVTSPSGWFIFATWSRLTQFQRQRIFINFCQKSPAQRVRHRERAADDPRRRRIPLRPIRVHLCASVFISVKPFFLSPPASKILPNGWRSAPRQTPMSGSHEWQSLRRTKRRSNLGQRIALTVRPSSRLGLLRRPGNGRADCHGPAAGGMKKQGRLNADEHG